MLRDAGFTFDKAIDPELPFVVADAEALSKCVENLVSNAMKYSGENRWIRLRAIYSARGVSPEVRISVEDKGMGISAADLPHVFEPFFRGQDAREGQIRGVGLGLYLVKRMMEAMDGGVSVSSKPSQGSVFTLHLSVLPTVETQHEEQAIKPGIAKA
jgi:signal transduction histidine kinase